FKERRLPSRRAKSASEHRHPPHPYVLPRQGRCPPVPAAKMAVLRYLRRLRFLCFFTSFRLRGAAAVGFFAADNFTSSSRLNVRRRLVPFSRNSISYQPVIRFT